ncbi:aldehyde dehydrogenase family protein [bacterium]|nr:aldehyde dehydrogenase family protein [bacterium]
MAEKFLNYIGGEWVEPSTGEWYENRNPANWDEVIGLFPRSNEEDVNRAVAAAKEAYKEWRLVPAPQRGKIMQKIGDLLVENKEDIARDMTREMGKVILETRGDTQEAIDTAYYGAGESRRLFAPFVPSELPNKFAFTMRVPLGVAGLITPWNFPSAIPAWKMFPAIVSGNTVVIKPATDTPYTVLKLAKIMEEAGLPPGVVNVVFGSGSKVGIPLVEHPDTSIISFTGSVDVGKDIAERAGRYLKKVSLELGGKNAVMIMDDANLELALNGVLWGAFGTTGQRCTATSRLLVQEGVYDKFIDMLVDAAQNLKLGNGLDESVDVGPLINKGQVNTVHSYVEIGKSEGAKLLCGGEPATEGELEKGWFYKPTVFADVSPDMRIFQEEIFGPVLSVSKFKTFEEGAALLNNSAYGLSSAIYTENLLYAMRAARDFEAGITYVNAPTIGAECHLPFGGVKNTGNGHREGGWTVYEIFTDWKTVYVDFSGRLQRAQIDDAE